MKFAKTLVLFLVALLALFSCSDNIDTSTREGLGDGPSPAVPANGGPYLYYFSNLDLNTGIGDLKMVASADPSNYDVLQSAAPIHRESVVMSYSGIPSLATLRSVNLTPAEMFYIDSGFFYRSNVGVGGDLRQQQITSVSNLDTVCDQTNDAFLDGIISATFLLELPGVDNDCLNRDDNILALLNEEDLISVAPLDITANLTVGTSVTRPGDISRIMNFSGNKILEGYLALNGTSLTRYDENFNQPQTITHNAQTTIELGNGGTGLAIGINNYVTVDGSVFKYNDETRSLASTALYTLPATATIEALVCKKEECLFVENNSGVLNLMVIKEDGSEAAKLLMANIQDVTNPDETIASNAFDSVQTMVRNTEKITFTASNSPVVAGEEVALYQIDISTLSSPLELNKVTTITTPLKTVLVKDTRTSKIDLFLTNALVYFNMNYDRIHHLNATSKAVVMTPDLRPEYVVVEGVDNDRTIYDTSAWIGVIDTEVSRERVIEKIILAQTIDKPEDPNADPIVLTGLPQTTLTAFLTSNHAVSANLGLLVPEGEPEVDVVHMSFVMVGNFGIGDAYIATTDPLDLNYPNMLQSDVYYIDALAAGSLTRLSSTVNDLENESAFTSCTNVGSLFCR